MSTAVRLKDVMTENPACCEPETSLVDVGRLLIENDCGAIPVVDDLNRLRPIGVITDRDIACRAVAEGRDALNLTAGNCMSSPCVTAGLEATLEDCCRLMDQKRVRRVVIVDNTGACCGIVTRADVARAAAKARTAEHARNLSEPAPPAA
jgi:CBS domain-containing protein